MTVLKMTESSQATYVATSVPKTVSLGKQLCKGDTKSMTLLMSKATEPTPANAKVKNLASLLNECQGDLRQEFQDSNLHFLYSRICIL